VTDHTDRLAILAELDRYDIHASDLQPDEFTQRQFIERKTAQGEAWLPDRTRDYLTRLVSEGVLTRRPVVHDACRCYAYRFAHPRETA